MKEKLIQLFNTMRKIEVKDESVLFLADCLRFTDQLIQEAAEAEKAPAAEPVEK